MTTREKSISRVTWLGMAINAVLTVFKLVAGIVGRSAAMMADGIHSLSDFISDIIVLVFLRISNRSGDKDYEFGRGKYETMATFLLSLILLYIAVHLMIEGVGSIVAVLSGEDVPIPGRIALIAAAVSIIAKEFCYQMTVRVGRKVDSPAVVANAWHHRSDALSSVGSLAGIGGAIILGDKWIILDPAMACIISVVILIVAVKVALPAAGQLLDVSLPDESENEIVSIASAVEGVIDVHNLKTRRSGSSIIIEMHILVDRTINVVTAHDIATEVESRLTEHFGDGTQTSVHIEPDTVVTGESHL